MSDEHLTVLLVEDSQADASYMLKLIKRCAHTTFEMLHAASLGTAIRTLEGTEVQVILLDLNLPDATGLNTLEHALKAAPDTPIIILTGIDDVSVARSAMTAGAQDYLVKGSFDADLFERAVNYALSRAKILRALRTSEERYALAVEGAKDGIWDWSLATGEVYYSPRWCNMLGNHPGELSTSPEEWFSRIHPDEVDLVKAQLDEHVAGRAGCFEVEYRMQHKDGDYRWVLSRGLAVRSGEEAVRIAGSQSDITDRKEVERRLLYSTLHDELTGLANRALLVENLKTAMLRSRRDRSSYLAVLAIALDRFEEIESSFGHAAGDEVLRLVARRFNVCLRAEDTLARVSRNQFNVLLEGVRDIRQVYGIAKRMQEVLADPITIHNQDIFVTVSVGIAISDEHYERPEEYLRDAGIAMHRARGSPGARHQLFDADMHERVLGRFKLETELREGLARGEFCMHYQPIVDLNIGTIAGFEALLRWNHPARGLLAPAKFIIQAEEFGLLPQIAESLWPTVLHDLASWQELGRRNPPLFVNLNLSKAQFGDPDFLGRLRRILADNPIEPFTLGIELTEGMIMEDAEVALEVIQGLLDLHIRMYLDDFGIGYSSLSRLHSLPINALKIDKTFITGLGSNPESSEISRVIVMLAHALGMSVTAEGVETADQLRRIRNLRCEYGQGYLFGRPVPVDEAAAMLTTRTLVGYQQATRAVDQEEEPGRVLVVDDDRATRHFIRLQLEEDGFVVETAATGAEGIEKAREWQPEVILLDIIMPGMDGLETCRQLKQSADAGNIPILFVTGQKDDEDTVVLALTAGGNDFLSKNSPPPILCARVRCQVSIFRAQAKLRTMAMTDELTGVFSRRFLFETLRREVKNANRRSPPGLGCLLVDVDHFKRVNDTLGHIAGDRVLREIATTIDGTTRETDIVARFGGEEFVIVLPGVQPTAAEAVAEKVRRAVESDCNVTISIGISHIGDLPMDKVSNPQKVDGLVQTLLKQADAAMYVAKERGRNRVIVFDDLG